MKPEKKAVRKTAAKPIKAEPSSASPKSKMTVPAAAKSAKPAEAKPATAEKAPEKKTRRKSPPEAAAATKSAPSPAAAKPEKKVARKKLEVPPILLEGDAPGTGSAPSKAGGPGTRFVLGQPGSSGTGQAGPATELPESYGTQRLFIAARDPHWLYCSWDLTREQQREFNGKSRDGHLVVRVFTEESNAKLPEVHVHPESRSWFLYVPKGETRYHAELGYYDAKSRWQSISVSRHTFTPADAPSTDISAEFATIPSRVTFRELVDTVQDFLMDNRPLLEAIAEANAKDPGMVPASVAQRESWTPLQIAEIAQLVSIDRFRRVWMGSLEITEMIRRRLQEDNASIAAAELARGGRPPGAESSLSSPFGGDTREKGRKFWFNINAELIIYGATEPDASVTIGDKEIKLRPDGSFSFRFALPDGNYPLPVAATSSDKEERRSATLQFTRSTTYEGKVQKHPQDARLRKPSAENVK